MKANTYLLVVIFVGLVALTGCKRNDPEKEGPCGVKDPTTELPWLKKVIENYEKQPGYSTTNFTAIGTTTFKGERVFWKYDPIVASDYPALYRCDGSYFYLPPQNLDKEQQEMLSLITNPSKSKTCPYFIWKTPYFQKVMCY